MMTNGEGATVACMENIYVERRGVDRFVIRRGDQDKGKG